VPYPVSLDAGAAYLGMAAGTGDVSGTEIAADKPVAVISGNSCAQVPVGTAFANTVLEEDIPASAWGTEFFTLPFAGRTGGDVYRIINAQANTTVNRNGTFLFSTGIADHVNTMNLTGASHITADKPIMLIHLAQGGQDDMSGDPTMIIVPPAGSYTRVQTIATPATGFANNRLNVAIATGDVGTLTLDGQPVAAGAFSPIGDTPTESGAQLSVTPGPHTLIAAGPFGIEAYGFAPDPASDAYGFPGAFGDPARAPAPAVTITIPADGATYTAGQVVDAAYSCSAPFGTAISACAGPVASGAAIDTSPGPHSFAVSAADGYGAHASASASYTVTPPSNQFALKLGKPNKKTGAETVTITVPGRGTVSGIETSKRGRTSVRVARVRRTAQAAGRFTLTFKPSAKATAILRRRHKLKVTISVTYTPTGGTARTKTARTTLRLTRR
jgi:hypothetical protein